MMGQKPRSPLEYIKTLDGTKMLYGTLHSDYTAMEKFQNAPKNLLSASDKKHVRDFMPKVVLQTHSAEIFSKEQFTTFVGPFQNKNLSAHVAVNLLNGLFKVEGHIGLREQERNFRQNIINDIFYAKVYCKILTAALVQLNRKKLVFSHEAEVALKEIDQRIEQNDYGTNTRRIALYNMCTNFIQTFGSHIDLGKFHFGAVLLWTSRFDRLTTLSLTQVSTLVEQSMQGMIGGGCGDFRDEVSATALRERGKIYEKYFDGDLKAAFSSFIQIGGPVGLGKKSEEEWIEAALDNINTLQMTCEETDRVPVWELINQLDSLKKNKEWIRGTMLNNFYTYQFRHKIDQTLNEKTIDNTEKLKLIDKMYEERRVAVRNTVEWENLLADKGDIQDFLLQFTVAKENLAEIFQIIKKLTDIDRDFLKKKDIKQMIQQIEEKTQDRTDIDKFVGGLQNGQGVDAFTADLAELNRLVKNVSRTTWLQILRGDNKISNFLLKPDRNTGFRIPVNLEHIDQLLEYAGQENFPLKEDIKRMLQKKRISFCRKILRYFGLCNNIVDPDAR